MVGDRLGRPRCCQLFQFLKTTSISLFKRVWLLSPNDKTNGSDNHESTNINGHNGFLKHHTLDVLSKPRIHPPPLSKSPADKNRYWLPDGSQYEPVMAMVATTSRCSSIPDEPELGLWCRSSLMTSQRIRRWKLWNGESSASLGY